MFYFSARRILKYRKAKFAFSDLDLITKRVKCNVPKRLFIQSTLALRTPHLTITDTRYYEKAANVPENKNNPRYY